MAAASEVPVDSLRRLARVFADADHAVAIPGVSVSGQTNGSASMLAVQALNVLVAQLGRVGGVYLSHPGPSAALRETPLVQSFTQVQEAIDRMRAGEVDLVMFHNTNPIFDLPPASGIAEAVARVPAVISFSSFVDEIAAQSDLILPDQTYLESWGYQVPAPGADRPVVTGQQPVVRPLYDTRSTGDVLIALGLQGSSLSAYDTRTTAGFWALWRQYGGWWSEQPIPLEPETTKVVLSPLPVVQPSFDGDPSLYPYHLHPYASIVLGDGRGANLPWLQETPDPMTTARL